MTYDEFVANRIREVIGDAPGISERKMFGGMTFMLNGNMCCGVVNDDLVVRVGPENYTSALEEPHARPMDFTGRPLTGFIYVSPDGYESPETLRAWIARGVEFARLLSPK